MRNLAQSLGLPGFQMRPLTSKLQSVLKAFNKLEASVLMPGLSEPTGPVNLLVASHTPDVSPWSSNGNVTAVGNTLSDTGAGDDFRFRNGPPMALDSTTRTTAHRIAKSTSAAYVGIFILQHGGTAQYDGLVANLLTGALTNVGGGSSSIAEDEDAWIVAKNVTNNGTNVSLQIRTYPAYNSNGSAVRNNDTTGSITLHGAGLFVGSYTAAEILAAGGIPRTALNPEANAYSSPIAALPYRTYLDSLGLDLLDSATQVDQPVGLALDGRGVNSGELLANGNFSQGASPWSFNTGWSLSGGKAVATAVPPGTQLLQVGRVLAGREYEATYTIEVTTGSVNVSSFSSGYSCPARTESGTYTDRFTPTTTASGNFAFVAVATFTGAVIMASLRDVAAGIEFVANGGFSSPVGWGISDDAGALTTISGGVAALASTSGTARLAQSVAFAVGKTYEVSWTQTGAGSAVYSGPSESLGSYTAGNNRRIFTATLNSNQIGFRNFTAGTSFIIDDVRVRDITGYHASQATTANKPTARRGIVNRVLWSHDYTNASWVKTGLTVSGAAVTPTVANVEHYLDSAALVFTAGRDYTKAVVAKANGYRYVRLAFPSSAFPASGRAAWFDLQTGQLGTVQGGVLATIAPVADGAYLCAIAATATATSTAKDFVSVANTDGGTLSFAGDSTSGLILRGIGGYDGAYTAAEILTCGGITTTTTAPASSASGVVRQWGPDLVPGGDFASAADWSLGTGWSITGGAAVANAAAANQQVFRGVSDGAPAGGLYLVSFDVLDCVSGSITGRVGGTNGKLAMAANGRYSEVIASAGTSANASANPVSTFTGKIGNFRVQRLAGYKPFHGQHFEFDGANDLLAYGGATLQNTSDHWVCASFECGISAIGSQSQVIYGNSNTANSNPLVCQLHVEAYTRRIQAAWRGTVLALASGPEVPMGQRVVATAAQIGSMGYLWYNGVLVASIPLGAIGATVVNTSTIGATVRNTTSSYFAGDIYHLSFGQSTLTEPDRKRIEAFAASQAGVQL